ncbi:MAG TPA: hypothetical protein VG935_03210 [Patescibacteria group bacterium]|nr:hypothetical protein [Patescibacteria group bacterium]
MKDKNQNLNDLFRSAIILPNIYKNIADSFNQISATILETQKAVFNMANYLDNFNKAIQAMVPDISKIIDFAESIKKLREIEKRALIESGWFICPSLDPVPYHYIRNAVIQYDKGRKGSVTVFMKSLYGDKDWEYLDKVVNGWSTNKFFTKQRVKIIKDALHAHKNGQYTLSIPALLPIIEGICGDFCKTQNIHVNDSASSQKAKNAMQKLKTDGKEYVSELVLEFIENQLYINTGNLRALRNKRFLNRHGILHGSYSGYADCARSLRCFLLLDVLTLL